MTNEDVIYFVFGHVLIYSVLAFLWYCVNQMPTKEELRR